MRFPQPGDVFEDRFRVERELGAGGFSNVYLVRDVSTGRTAALKVLIPDGDDGYTPETRARFDREVAAIASLTHPNTVTLYDCGESRDGLLFLSFEHIPGEDLTDLLARAGRLDGQTVRAILTQVLGALREAHDAGIIHRDIKPENLRVCSAPGEPVEVRLLDFGIARPTDHGSPSITKTGELIGTPRYMSPEHLKEQRLTPAADIYSLGVVAFELLVGRDAMPGNRWSDQLERLQTGHVFSIPLSESVGSDLLAVIQRMTAVDPAQRLSTAAATLAALDTEPVTQKLQAPATTDDAVPLRVWGGAFAVLAALAFLLVLAPQEQEPERRPAKQRTAPTKLLKRKHVAAPEPVITPVTGPDASSLDAAAVDTGPDSTGSPGCRVHTRLLQREFLVFEPTRFPDEPAPLIVWLHSNNQDDPGFTPRSEAFKELIEAEGVVVVVPPTPNPLVSSWSAGHLRQLEAMTHVIMSQLCIDPERVYVWSSAGGGHLANRVACEPWVSGVAISTYVEPRDEAFDCAAPRPVFWMAATDSIHQPIGGGRDCLFTLRHPFEVTRARLQSERGCIEDGKVTVSKEYVRCRQYSCDVPLTSCEVNGGLGWPGTPQPEAARRMHNICPEPPPEPRFNAARHAWDFFEGLADHP